MALRVGRLLALAPFALTLTARRFRQILVP
jgi:hypothetical protein